MTLVCSRRVGLFVTQLAEHSVVVVTQVRNPLLPQAKGTFICPVDSTGVGRSKALDSPGPWRAFRWFTCTITVPGPIKQQDKLLTIPATFIGQVSNVIAEKGFVVHICDGQQNREQ